MFNIVLVEPRIPQNTGTIGRMALATNSVLHLIEPMGFVITDKHLKRAGMDYWKDIDVQTWASLEAFWEKHPFGNRHFLATTKSDKYYLITGGLGGLGIELTQWMFEKGATKFILMSRSRHVKSCLNIGGPSSKPKYLLITDSETVP